MMRIFSPLLMLLLSMSIGLAAAFPASWLAASQHWPPTDAAAVKKLQAIPPEEAARRFAQWASRTLAEDWLPREVAAVPYLRDWGFVHTRQTADYRLRVREVMRPVYPGAREMQHGLVVSIEPVRGRIPLPATPAEMRALLGKFLTPASLDWPDDPIYRRPVFTAHDKAAFYALPRNLYARTDGAVLCIAYYDDPVYQAPDTVLARLPKGKRPAYRPARDGSLHYPLERTMRNPWIVLAASDWPANTARTVKAPAEAHEYFTRWTRGMVQPDWLPADVTKTPYVRDIGLVSVKATKAYRVRIRQGVIVTSRPSRAVLLAVEPLASPLPLPKDAAAMTALLKKFVTAELLALPALEQCPPELSAHAGGMHYARYRTESASAAFPVDLFAWGDGTMLFIALVESLPGDCPTCTY